MKFSQDYTKFFDLNPYTQVMDGPFKGTYTNDNTEPQFVIQNRYDLTQNDFILNCSKFLEEHDILWSTAGAIAGSLFARMADQRLHYHTPVHVLWMFQFAQEQFPDQAFAPWEELAIWFHDAVYIPNLNVSEELSAQYMLSMVSPAFTNSELSAAQFAIETTAQHLDPVTNELYNTVMDLDLIAMSWNSFEAQSAAIRKEFDYVDDATYQTRRKAFLNRMLAKGFVYRSPLFKERYEDLAWANIKQAMEKLENV